jgi:hypothetical protein
MRTLKHISGILLAAVGVTITLGAAARVFTPDPELPLWMAGVLFVLLGLLPLAAAFLLLRAALTAPAKSCPQCGGTQHLAAGVLRSSHNRWLFHFGGWLLASLWGASRERQVRCAQCESLYLTDTRGTRIAGVLLWVFLLLVVFGLVAQRFVEQ